MSAIAGYNAYRTGGVYCLGDGVLYLRRGAKCLCLDARTGARLGSIPMPDPEKHDFWGYLAYSDGIVYATAASTSHTTVNPYPSNSDGVVEGKTLFAVDAKTKRLLWQFEPKEYIGNNAVAIDSSGLYLIDRPTVWADRSNRLDPAPDKSAKPGRLLSLHKKTGKVRWTVETRAMGSAVLVSESARRVCIWHKEKLTGYDADSGKRVYEIESKYGVDKYGVRAPLIAGNTIYWHRFAFDVRTGKKLAQELSRSYGCGGISASRNMLFFRSGTIGYVDLKAPRINPNRITTDDIRNFGGIRPGCYINTIPAGGLVLVPDTSSSCRCSYFNQCWLALQPRVTTRVMSRKGDVGEDAAKLPSP